MAMSSLMLGEPTQEKKERTTYLALPLALALHLAIALVNS
jgi:hypothetical protein